MQGAVVFRDRGNQAGVGQMGTLSGKPGGDPEVHLCNHLCLPECFLLQNDFSPFYLHSDGNLLVLPVCVLSCFSRVRLFTAPWTVPHWAPLSKEFSRKEYWSVLPCFRIPSQSRDRTHVSYKSCIDRRALYHERHQGSPTCLSWVCLEIPQILFGGGCRRNHK